MLAYFNVQGYFALNNGSFSGANPNHLLGQESLLFVFGTFQQISRADKKEDKACSKKRTGIGMENPYQYNGDYDAKNGPDDKDMNTTQYIFSL